MDPADVPIDLGVGSLAALQRRRSEKWADLGPGVISATIAEMDFPLARPIAEVLRAAIARDDLGYAPGSVSRLAAAFAGFAGRRLHWEVDPDQVTLIPDVMVGMLELARHLAGPGGSIAFASPAYPPFLVEPACAGLQIQAIVNLDDGTTDLKALEAAFAGGARVFVLANPHNPTGRVLSREELHHIAKIAEDHGAWVVADEIHAPLVLPGATHTPWLQVSEEARRRGFALTSASKAFNVAALKAALMVTASGPARDVVTELPPQSDHAGLLGVLAAEAAFTEGDAWLDAVITQLDSNRTQLRTQLASQLPAIRWSPPDATYLAWLDCRSLHLGDDPAAVLLAEAAVALSPGLTYGHVGAGHVRLNFGTSPELLTEIIGRITTAVDHRTARAEISRSP